MTTARGRLTGGAGEFMPPSGPPSGAGRAATCSSLHCHQEFASETTRRLQMQLSIVTLPSASISISAKPTHGSSGHVGHSGIGPVFVLILPGGISSELGQ